MSGSGDRRYAVSEETATHIKENKRVAQLKDQLNNKQVASPFDGIVFTEEIRPDPNRYADPADRSDAQNDLSILTPETRGQHAQAHLGIDVNDPQKLLRKIDGAGVTFEECDRDAASDEELNEMLGSSGLPEGYQPPEIGRRNAVQAVIAPNMFDQLNKEMPGKLAELEIEVARGYEMDLTSRKDWAEGVDAAKKLMKSRLQSSTSDGTKPRTPLLQTAAQQFEARMTPILISQGRIVKMHVQGEQEAPPQMPTGPDGQPVPAAAMTPELAQQAKAAEQHIDKTARAERVSRYLSYLLRKRSKTWITDTRKLLVRLALNGTVFRKVIYSAQLGRVTSRLIDGVDIVFKADAASLDEAPRITHRYNFQANQVISMIRSGAWRDISTEIGVVLDGSIEQRSDEQLEFLECHLRYDIDDDGYPEPIIVTTHKHTGRIVRIERNYDNDDVVTKGNKVIHIEPRQCFVMYGFLPNPDGTLYSIGLGHTMAGQLDQINTLVKQMLDQSILANSTGGFMARGLRLGRGQQDVLEVKPNRYHYVNATGDKLRDSIVPFQLPQPSQVNFQLLDLFLSQARDLAAVINPISADDLGASFGRMPVGTILALLETSFEVFSGILSGVYQSMSQEFELLYKNVGKFLDEDDYRNIVDSSQASARDFQYADEDITPLCDPRTGTNLQRSLKAEKYKGLIGNPVFNQGEVIKRYVEAEGFENPLNLLATPDQRQQELNRRRQELALRAEELSVMEREAKIQSLLSGANLSDAKAHKTEQDAEAVALNMELAPIELEVDARKSMHGKQDREISPILGKDPTR